MILLHAANTNKFNSISCIDETDKITVLSFPSCMQEARKDMHEFLEDIGFKSYYSRYWITEEGGNIMVCDYGSHTMFFYIIGTPDLNLVEEG